MAWRAQEIAPSSTLVEVEMTGWVIYGAGALVVGLFWEGFRALQRLNSRYEAPEGNV
jgi:hypothetical protein